MRSDRTRTTERADVLSKGLCLVSLLIFIPAMLAMNYGVVSSNRGLFGLSLFLALAAAVMGGWAIKVKTGTLLMGVLGAGLLYLGEGIIFAFQMLLTS